MQTHRHKTHPFNPASLTLAAGAPQTPPPKVPAAAVSELEARLRSINTLATMQRTSRSRVPLDYVLGVGGFDLEKVEDQVGPKNQFLFSTGFLRAGKDAHVPCSHGFDEAFAGATPARFCFGGRWPATRCAAGLCAGGGRL
jgi:hypothetical protein